MHAFIRPPHRLLFEMPRNIHIRLLCMLLFNSFGCTNAKAMHCIASLAAKIKTFHFRRSLCLLTFSIDEQNTQKIVRSIAMNKWKGLRCSSFIIQYTLVNLHHYIRARCCSSAPSPNWAEVDGCVYDFCAPSSRAVDVIVWPTLYNFLFPWNFSRSFPLLSW